MVNRNVARHLALVVSILLCFFIYMGYRYRGQPETPSQPTDSESVSPVDVAKLLTDAGAVRQSPVSPPPAGSGAGLSPPGRSPFPATEPSAAGRRPQNNGGDSLPAPPADNPARRDEKLRPPPAPSGSIEETTASKTPNASTIITGLIPDPADGQPTPDQSSPSAPPRQAGTGPAPEGAQAAGSRSVQPLAPKPASEAANQAPPAPDNRSAPPNPTPAPPRANAPAGQNPPPAAIRPPPPATVPTRPGTFPAPNQGAVAPYRPDGSDPSPAPALRLYVIRPGDTLIRIAARELGSLSLANNIYLLNRDLIADPDRLMAGERIRLPSRDPVGTPASQPPPAGPRQPGRPTTHQVVGGDTLSSIAMQYYGSSGSWRGIFEANRNILSSPNRLAVGMELIIPPNPE